MRFHERLVAALIAGGVTRAAIAGISVISIVPLQARVDYSTVATLQDQTLGAAVLAAFDYSQAAQDAWEAQNNRRAMLLSAAQQAIADNNTFIALVTPTTAQVAAQVKRLSQECNHLIRRLTEI